MFDFYVLRFRITILQQSLGQIGCLNWPTSAIFYWLLLVRPISTFILQNTVRKCKSWWSFENGFRSNLFKSRKRRLILLTFWAWPRQPRPRGGRAAPTAASKEAAVLMPLYIAPTIKETHDLIQLNVRSSWKSVYLVVTTYLLLRQDTFCRKNCCGFQWWEFGWPLVFVTSLVLSKMHFIIAHCIDVCR